MREPRWTEGAYTVAPHVVATGTEDGITASAAVECWKGNLDELCEPVKTIASLISTRRPADISILVTWDDGVQEQVASVDSFASAMARRRPNVAVVIRFEVRSEDNNLRAVLIGRRLIPGMTLEISGQDEAKVRNLIRTAFHRLMIGYVDRMGGWRGITWMLTALAPLLLGGMALSGAGIPSFARTVFLVVASIGSLATFKFAYTRLLVGDAFEVIWPATGSGNTLQEWNARLKALWRRRGVRPTVAILGSLALGVLSDEIAEMIRLPW